MIEIQNLAVAIRDTAALDSEGIVAAQMAEDLADTNPLTMQSVFALARKRCNWLPRTAEMFDLYEEVLKASIQIADRHKEEVRRQSEDALREDRQQHPEKYVTFGQVVAETPGAAEFVAGLQKRADIVRTQKAAQDNAPKIEECPGCGLKLPMRVADLRGLTIEDFRAWIEVKEKRQQLVAQGAAIAAAHQPAAPQKPKRKRTKKGTAMGTKPLKCIDCDPRLGCTMNCGPAIQTQEALNGK